jgi:hypothetical protein
VHGLPSAVTGRIHQSRAESITGKGIDWLNSEAPRYAGSRSRGRNIVFADHGAPAVGEAMINALMLSR